MWSKVQENYQRLGINLWWLDACEPEMKPGHPANLRYHAGRGQEVANLYPRENARLFHEGMAASGNTDGMSFSRSAWAGSQRYGTAVWSGDIGTDFAALRAQIAAGLNIGLSGIPWWTTDIGGFHGGDPTTRRTAKSSSAGSSSARSARSSGCTASGCRGCRWAAR